MCSSDLGRVRAGGPANAAGAAVPLLEDDGWPQSLKIVALDELAIRYGLVPDFDPELPRDPNGKLYKRLVRERYWAGRDSRIL